MSSHETKERIAADLLIAQMQLKSKTGDYWTAEEVAKDFQTIYNQVYKASTVAAQMLSQEASC